MPHRAKIRHSTGLSGENSRSLLKIKDQNASGAPSLSSTKFRRRMKCSGSMRQSNKDSTYTPEDTTVTIRKVYVQLTCRIRPCSLIVRWLNAGKGNRINGT